MEGIEVNVECCRGGAAAAAARWIEIQHNKQRTVSAAQQNSQTQHTLYTQTHESTFCMVAKAPYHKGAISQSCSNNLRN